LPRQIDGIAPAVNESRVVQDQEPGQPPGSVVDHAFGPGCWSRSSSSHMRRIDSPSDCSQHGQSRQTPRTASSVRGRGTSALITNHLTRTPLSALMVGTPGAAGEGHRASDILERLRTSNRRLLLTCRGGQRSPPMSSLLTPCQCAVSTAKSPAGLSSRDTRPMVWQLEDADVVNPPKPRAGSSSPLYVMSSTRQDQEPVPPGCPC